MLYSSIVILLYVSPNQHFYRNLIVCITKRRSVDIKCERHTIYTVESSNTKTRNNKTPTTSSKKMMEITLTVLGHAVKPMKHLVCADAPMISNSSSGGSTCWPRRMSAAARKYLGSNEISAKGDSTTRPSCSLQSTVCCVFDSCSLDFIVNALRY